MHWYSLADLPSLVPLAHSVGPAAWLSRRGANDSSATFGLFRYFLLAIPMVTCIALTCWTPTPEHLDPRGLPYTPGEPFGGCAAGGLPSPSASLLTVIASLN